MKIRSTEEFIDTLSSEAKWRKQELISLMGRIKGHKKPAAPDLRAGVVFSYAHWEGFVKVAAQAYVKYATIKSRPLQQLNNSFRALSCRDILISSSTATKKIQPHLTVVEQLTDGITHSKSIDPSKEIDTESNLNFAVFSNICQCIGLDPSGTWATKGPFMDDMFLSRCSIAHGENYCPDQKYAMESIHFTISSIDEFSINISNAAISRDFIHPYYRPLKSI